MQDAVFYCIAFMMIASSIFVVSSKNLLHAALGLVFSLFLSAALFIMLHAEFVAMAQVMVYVGGIVIFMIFSILLTTGLGEKIQQPNLTGVIIALIASLSFFVFMFRVLDYEIPVKENLPEQIASLEGFGIRLMNTHFGGFIVPFEVISILLLAAMVGAIVIAKKDKTKDKA